MARRIQKAAAKLTGSWVFWLVVLAASFSLPLVRSLTREIPEPPRVYGQLPEFELTDQDGDSFGLADLSGKVWIANFIFTSCGDVCPRLTSRMREIQNRLDKMGDSVHLVSFSVDPVHDTPQKLRDYADAYGARRDIWTFVTGPLDAIESTVVGGFKMVMQIGEMEDTGFFNIVHGERFVLVDQRGRIRGYYEADDEGIQHLLNHAGLLANLGPGDDREPAVISRRSS
jgi:protein SCO1/2